MAFYLNDLYTLLLLFCIMIFSTIIFYDSKRIPLALEYLFNQKYGTIYHRTDSIFYRLFTSINTSFIFGILISFYLFSTIGVMSLAIFLKGQLLLLLFYLIKSGIVYFLGIIFENPDLSKKYYYGSSTNLFICSIFMLPLIIFFSYFQEGYLIGQIGAYLPYICMVLYFFLKILLLKRLNVFKINLVFYNILYLCAIEISPYLILLRLIKSL